MQPEDSKDAIGNEEHSKPHQPDEPSSALPADDPTDYEKKVWVEAVRFEASAAVTVSSGDFGSNGAPYDLFLEFGRRTLEAFRAFGGGTTPTIIAAIPVSSMSLYLRDPHDDSPQKTLPVEATRATAGKMASLMALRGDELFARALEIGSPSLSYRNLVEFVVEHGLEINIAVADEAVTLDRERAIDQLAILDREPDLVSETRSVRGVLYRVIEKGPTHGTIGIRLDGKLVAGGHTGRTRLYEYVSEDVREVIRNGLIGEAVEIQVDQQRPRYGTSISSAPVREQVIAIQKVDLPRGLWT